MTTLFIIIFIFILVLPTLIIGFLAILERRRKKEIKTALQAAIGQLVNENGLLIVEIEYFRNKAIGIDRKKKKLLFVHYKGFVDKSCIDLETLAFCRVVKTKDQYSKDIKNAFIEVKNNGNTEVSRLVFYDRSSDSKDARTSMTKKAEYWKNKINLHRRTVDFN